MVLLGRFGVAKIGFALLFALVTGYAFAAAVSIANTKHNFAFGGTGTGTVKADAAAGAYKDQICVFCHTPHFAMTAQPLPLWNKQLTTATYTTYTSDYLTSLGYPTAAPFAPGQSSRTCLSCHDGTVAIGAVYNINGTAAAGIVSMAGTTGGMMSAGVYNLGTNLADDHPVGYEYKPGGAYPPVPGQLTDPELLSYAAGPGSGGAVKLEPNLATGLVECKSCHEPHDDQFKKFLRTSLVNGELCKVCHNKTNYAASGHDLSTQAYQTTDPRGRTRVTDYSCLACHRPHNGQTLPLLKGAEEVTCFAKGCHGSDTTTGSAAANVTVGSLNIEGEFVAGKLHKHPTSSISGKHKDIPSGESTTQLGGVLALNRHAECYDCHNPHQVQVVVGKSTRGTLRISAALKGTWGVKPTWPAAPVGMANNLVTFAAPAAFTRVSGAQLTDEYQVCLKCHSNYITLPAGARNLAAEINPNNSSYHGIVPFLNDGVTRPVTNFFVNTNTMNQPWGGQAMLAAASETCRTTPTGAACVALANSRGRVWCSDCHNSDAAPVYPSVKSATIPSGPHGSTLNGTGPGTSNTDKMLIASIATAATGGTPLCLRCHLAASTLSGNSNSRSGRHGADTTIGRAPDGCFACHMWENPAVVTGGTGDIFPHGMNKRWATIGTSATPGTLQMVDSFSGGWHENMNYTAKQCWEPGLSTCNGEAGSGY